MALNSNINDAQRKRELESLGITPDGDMARRVWSENSSGSLLDGVEFDAVTRTLQTSTQEIYRFYTGGTGGSLTATITIDYTDDTLEFITQAVKT